MPTECCNCGADAPTEICDRCAAHCARCDARVVRFDMSWVDGERWCEDCRCNYAYYCDVCDGDYASEHHHDDDDEEEAPYDPGDALAVHSYDFNPHAWRKLRATQEGPVAEYYAVELEVAYNYQSNAAATMQRIFDGASDVYFKHDGSIADGSCGPGVEIVTQPCSYAWWQEHRDEWNRRLRTMRQVGFRSFDAGTCGLHIHVSREPFGATHLLRMQNLVYDNAEVFRRISQRSTYTYCAFDSRDAQDPRFRVLKAGTARFSKSYRYFDYDPHSYADRRVAVNFPNDTPTVEFRFFRGTLNEGSFWKALETVHSIAAYVRESADTTADAYLRWVFKRHRSYPHLTTFLHQWYQQYRDAEQHRRGTKFVPPTFSTIDT